MEGKIAEALRAKENAEKLFAVRDFVGAKSNAIKARTLCPQLEGISQMVATFEIYASSLIKVNGEFDFYSILGLDPSVDKPKLKRRYKKMAVVLHPDKNKTMGADGAFKLVSEAWTMLSDNVKRSAYDIRRNKHLSSHKRLDTFWTVCTSCHIQYEYLRKYVNKRLSCKNCRGVFIAVETGVAPANGSFPYSSWSYTPENGHGSHGYNGVTYVPNTAVCFSGNGVSGIHSGHVSEYVPNISFQWGSTPAASAGVVKPNGLHKKTVNVVNQANGSVIVKPHVKNYTRNVAVGTGSNGHNEHVVKKLGRPPKKRKVDVVTPSQNGHEEKASKTEPNENLISGNGNIKHPSKLPTLTEISIRRTVPTFDARKLLIDKARTVIRNKLEEIRLATEVGKSTEAPKRDGLTGLEGQPELKRTMSIPITVPDSDFHDFDKDRSEECFNPKQVWALYDEEDGMPRLYCLIREVISVKPFKIHISYLSAKTDSEFGSVNWVDSGFTKSCGNFRAFTSEIVEEVNVFSHLLSREKAGRGGRVRIYPRKGTIWAIYRYWSPDWNRTTPDKERHKYEMVEVLEDYSEELGVWVTPLIKLDGFKTVYQRSTEKDAVRWIPRGEMMRFSHQVPSCLLKGEARNFPDGCWDLDPAATPDEFLQVVTEAQDEDMPNPA